MKKVLVILVILVIVAAVLLLLLTQRDHSDESTIRLSGNIEVTEVQLSFRLPGWVRERLVDEGQSVKQGDIIARLDSRDLETQVALRQAAVDSARAALLTLENGSRPEEIAAARAAADQAKHVLAELTAGSRPQEIQVAQAAVGSAKAQLAYAEVEFRRMEQMPPGAVSQAQKDLSRMNFDTAQAKVTEAQERLKLVSEGPRQEQIAQARAALDAAQQQLALVEKGPREEAIAQARARLAEAQSAMRAAELQLSYATIASPINGVVLSENIEPGEFVVAGTPVVTVANLSDVWLRGYIGGEDLGQVKLGQAVDIRTDSFPNTVYRGTISFIASEAEFTPKSVQTEKERTRLVYRVKIDVPNPEMQLKPGMPADAVISLAP